MSPLKKPVVLDNDVISRQYRCGYVQNDESFCFYLWHRSPVEYGCAGRSYDSAWSQRYPS